MDYKKLADLLFPNLKNTVEYYELLYPNRKIKEGQEVTRFAPSPTGFVHLGNFFGAYLDYWIAKSTGGVFYIRLEDTDEKRKISGAEKVALRMLYHYGIKNAEGLMKNGTEAGNYGPYVQSKRVDIYKAYAKYLVEQGKAFPCFCNANEGGKKEIDERRKQELEESETIEEKDIACRSLTFDEIKKKVDAGEFFAVKLRSEGDPKNKIKFSDVRGEREISENGKDVVLLKSDGIPPYAFAHIVDDYLMRTTLVVRGQDYYSSLAQHLEIAKALGVNGFRYLHNPLLSKLDSVTGNKRKLSKRYDPEADMRYFEKEGYPKESVLEYLLTLMNSNFEIWRLENPKAKLENFPFSLSKIGTSDPMVDINKLDDISKRIVSVMSAKKVYSNVLKWAKKNDKEFANFLTSNKDYSVNFLNIDRQKENPRKDIYKWNQVPEYFDYMWKDIHPDTSITGVDSVIICEVLNNYAKQYSEKDSKDEWYEKTKQMASDLGFAVNNKEFKSNPSLYKGNLATVFNIIRVATTGKTKTPELYDICKILGKFKLKDRYNAIKKCNR